MKLPLIIIYTGALPEYLKYSCLLNSENNEIILITDAQVNWSMPKVKIINLNDFYNKSPEIILFKNYVSIANSETREFRNGFWIKTTERFFILKAYMDYAKIGRVLHIEADNLLFTNSVETVCNNAGDELLFPRLDSSNAAASILYVGCVKSLEKFCLYISSRTTYKTDMQLLSDFSLEQPMTAKNIYSEWNLAQNDSLQNNGFICDAAAIGQFFFGVDPRNIGRPLFNGFKNNSIDLDYKKFKLYLDQSKSEATLSYEGRSYILVNLHIHSKIFKKIINKQFLNKIVTNLNCGKQNLILFNFKNLKYIRNIYKFFHIQ